VWTYKFERVRTKFKAASGGQDWARLFRQYDHDDSGALAFDEFRRAVWWHRTSCRLAPPRLGLATSRHKYLWGKSAHAFRWSLRATTSDCYHVRARLPW
jgi:hypothetical protein